MNWKKILIVLILISITFCAFGRMRFRGSRRGHSRHRNRGRSSLNIDTIRKEQLDAVNTQAQIDRKRDEEERRKLEEVRKREIDRLKHEIEITRLKEELKRLRQPATVRPNAAK